MVFEIQNELIFGYETFREGQVQRDYSARYIIKFKIVQLVICKYYF